MKMMRCTVNHIAFTMRDGRTEDFQKGMEVNFDRVLTPETGFMVGQAFEGKEDCFEPVGPPLLSPGELVLNAGRQQKAVAAALKPLPEGE